jgi:hypothetical protein
MTLSGVGAGLDEGFVTTRTAGGAGPAPAAFVFKSHPAALIADRAGLPDVAGATAVADLSAGADRAERNAIDEPAGVDFGPAEVSFGSVLHRQEPGSSFERGITLTSGFVRDQ